MKKIKLIIIAVNILGVIFQYGLSIYRSDNGLKVAHISSEITKLNKENSDLSRQYFELASLSQIEKRAQELNMSSLPSTTLAPITVAEAVTH